jgi:tetratricopeptide (TPR) repeat protein
MDVPATRDRRKVRWPVAAVGLLAVLTALWVLTCDATPEARWRAIQERINRKDWPGAERLLGRWVAGHPGDGPAWLNLGSVYGMLGDEERAGGAFRRVPVGDPAWGRAQVLLGELAVRGRRRAEAEAIYRGLAAREPTDLKARAGLVHLLLVQRRVEEARALLWEYYRLTRDPRHLVSLTGLALESGPQRLRDVSGEADRFERDLTLFLERTPDDPWLVRGRGLLRYEMGRPAEARADLEESARAFEDDPVGRLALADCRIELGDPAGIEDALGPPPGRADLLGRWWVVRGQVERDRGRLPEAIDCWKAAAVADPQNRAARYQLGQALVGLGRRAEAGPYLAEAEAIRRRTEDLKRAVNDRLGGGPDGGAEACEALGRLCQAAGLGAEGRAWLEEAIRIEPTRGSSQSALARAGAGPAPSPIAPRLRRPALPPRTAGPGSVARPAAGPRFVDEARRRGLVFSYDCGATGDLFIADSMGGGVGLLDADGDGRLDVYFVNGCRLPIDPARPPAPNRLYRNNGDGTFADVTARAGVAGRGYGMGCAVGDYDNDGRDDLFVTGLGSTVLYRNNGDGTFADVTAKAGVGSTRWCTAAGFGDLDGDGDLDLVVVTYVEADPRHSSDCHGALGRPIHCPPGRFPAQFDHLFRNNGDGTFSDVGREAGLEVPDGRGLGLAIADLDGDGRLDLFIANDAVPNFVFRNRGGLRFEEVATAAGAAYDGHGNVTASMGVVADDLDGDGRLDLFHTNFRNEGNTFLRNLGGGLYVDASARAGLDAPSRPMTGFGTAALDADNDGRLDLFVANGHTDDQPWIRQPMAQRPHWYTGLADGRFDAASAADVSAYFSSPVVGRGVAAGDLDNDGLVDLVVVHRDAPAALLRNTSRGGHWLGLHLVGTASSRTPIGARATCRAGGRTFVRWLTDGTGYLSAHDHRLWFGLGGAATVDELEVLWPSGALQRLSGLKADRLLELHEPGNPGPPARNTAG